MRKILFVLISISILGFSCVKDKEKTKDVKMTEKKEMKEKVKAEAKKAQDENLKGNAVIKTKFGEMVIEFFPELAPGHVANFKKLAKMGFYNGTTFHRVIPGFMVQGGDPNSKDENRANDGMGGPGYTIKAEFNKTKHKRGIVSMARSQDPDSAGSQFFICVADAPFLDGKYSVFGKVVKGMEVADKIVSQQRDKNDNPLKKIEMQVSVVE